MNTARLPPVRTLPTLAFYLVIAVSNSCAQPQLFPDAAYIRVLYLGWRLSTEKVGSWLKIAPVLYMVRSLPRHLPDICRRILTKAIEIRGQVFFERTPVFQCQ